MTNTDLSYNIGGYKHNYRVNILDTGIYLFAMRVLSPEIVLPAFALSLGSPEFLIAFIPSVMMIGVNLPAVFSSYYIQKLRFVKPVLVKAGFFQRLPWLLIALLILQLASTQPGYLLILFYIGFVASSISIGIGAPAHNILMNKAIPENRRGRFFANIIVLGSLLALAGGWFVKLIMESPDIPYPYNYTILFFSAAVALFISYGFFLQNRERDIEPHPELKAASLLDYLKKLWPMVREDKSFRRFTIGSILLQAQNMGAAYFIVFFLRKFDLSDRATGDFVLAMTLGSILTSLVLGRLADRYGYKVTLLTSAFSYALAVMTVFLANNLWLTYSAFVLLAISRNSFQISRNNSLYKLSENKNLAAYTGVFSMLNGPALILYSTLAGFIVSFFEQGYRIVFIFSACLALASVAFLLALKFPESRSPV